MFRHVLMQAVIYNDLLPGERRSSHERYAQCLKNTSTATAAEMAHHYFEAGQLPEALDASLQAADAAWRSRGYAECRVHYERAIELWPRVLPSGHDLVALLSGAAAAGYLEGDAHKASQFALEAIQQLTEEDERLPSLSVRYGTYLAEAGESASALNELERVIERFETRVDGVDRAEMLCAYAQALASVAQHGESAEHAQAALALSRSLGDRIHETRALTILGIDLVALGEPETGAEYLFGALEIAETLDDPNTIADCYNRLAVTLSGPLNRLEDALRVSLDGAVRVGELGLDRHWGTSLRSIAADTLFRMGRWHDALKLFDDVLHRSAKGSAALDLHLARAKVTVGLGEFELAEEGLKTIRQLAAGAVDVRYRVPLATLGVGLALWRKQLSEARRIADEALAHYGEGPSEDVWFFAPLVWHAIRTEAEIAQVARAAFDHAEIEAAVTNAQRLRRMSSEMCEMGVQQGALRLLVDAYDGMCEGELLRAQAESSAKVWHDVVLLWDALGQPYPAAYARFCEAEAHLAAPGGNNRAAAPLREAFEATTLLGAIPLQLEIVALAERARIPLQVSVDNSEVDVRDETTPIEQVGRNAGLTKRELQVLECLGNGKSNREIAELFFISEKTASVHVSNILAKLGVRSRAQAATMIHTARHDSTR